MAGPIGLFLGQFSINATTMAVSNIPNCNIAAGDYYATGYTGESQFANAVQSGIRQAPGQANAIVSFSTTSKKYTITLNAAANIDFLTTRLANIMGWSNGTNQPSAAVHTAPSQARYVWGPSKAPSDLPCTFRDPLSPRSSTVSGRAPDGTTFTVAGSTVYDGAVEYKYLADTDVIGPESGTVYVDLRQWFLDIPAGGKPFRWVMNRDRYAATTDYQTCIWYAEGKEEVGSFEDYIGREFQRYNGLWSVKVPLAKKV